FVTDADFAAGREQPVVAGAEVDALVAVGPVVLGVVGVVEEAEVVVEGREREQAGRAEGELRRLRPALAVAQVAQRGGGGAGRREREPPPPRQRRDRRHLGPVERLGRLALRRGAGGPAGGGGRGRRGRRGRGGRPGRGRGRLGSGRGRGRGGRWRGRFGGH